MPNDAKLGMVAGVALVIVVAVVFFRRDAAAGAPNGPKAVTPAPRTSSGRTPAHTPTRPASEKAGGVERSSRTFRWAGLRRARGNALAGGLRRKGERSA